MSRDYRAVLDALAASSNPIVRYKAAVYGRGLKPSAKEALALRTSIRNCPVAQRSRLDLESADPETREGVAAIYHTLRYLADIDYPPRDPSLRPYRDQVYAWLRRLESQYDGPLHIRGRHRVHGSFHGNAIHASIVLGLANATTDALAKNLLRYQWPGGGWNCSKKPTAKGATIVHTAYGLRGLVTYRSRKASPALTAAIDAGARILLERQVYLSRRTGAPLRPIYTKLSYPYPRLYDFMVGLHVLARSGHIEDPRCERALDLLESKFIDGEGWATERKTPEQTHTLWQRENHGRANPFLTVDALEILKRAGRLST